MTRLTNPQILDAGLTDWRTVTNHIAARFATVDFETGADFVAAIAEAAEEADHHPDITLTYRAVDVTLMTHTEGGVTEHDIDLARAISMLAVDRGIAAVPEAVQLVELALDTVDQSEIDQFWSVILTGSPNHVDEDTVIDPGGRAPLLWFQEAEPHAVPAQRFHLDVSVAPEEIQRRTDAALEAGGIIAWETPHFRVLQDRQGNRACICWAEGRNEGPHRAVDAEPVSEEQAAPEEA